MTHNYNNIRCGQTYGLRYRGICLNTVRFHVHDINVRFSNIETVLLECTHHDLNINIKLYTLAAGYLSRQYYDKTCEINELDILNFNEIFISKGIKFFSDKASFDLKFYLIDDKSTIQMLETILGCNTGE